MSDGQSRLVPGTSDDSSIENSTDSTAALSSLALLGNLYSTLPRPNQISAACTRAGSRKESGTSSRPITPSVEHSPHGVPTSTEVNRPSGIATSTTLASRCGSLALEAHDDLVELRRADLLVALLRLHRLGRDQARLLQRLHVDGDRRLRQRQPVADVVDVELPLAAQQLQDADADRRRQPLEDVDVLLRVDGQEVGFHECCEAPGQRAAVFISEILIVQSSLALAANFT